MERYFSRGTVTRAINDFKVDTNCLFLFKLDKKIDTLYVSDIVVIFQCRISTENIFLQAQ